MWRVLNTFQNLCIFRSLCFREKKNTVKNNCLEEIHHMININTPCQELFFWCYYFLNLLWKVHTRHPVKDLSQGGGDGEVKRAVLVASAVHGMLDEVTGSIDASFVQL